MRQIKSNQNHS